MVQTLLNPSEKFTKKANLKKKPAAKPPQTHLSLEIPD